MVYPKSWKEQARAVELVDWKSHDMSMTMMTTTMMMALAMLMTITLFPSHSSNLDIYVGFLLRENNGVIFFHIVSGLGSGKLSIINGMRLKGDPSHIILHFAQEGQMHEWRARARSE